jgi:UDP-glucose 4-epimerase
MENGNGDGYCLGPKEMYTIRDVAEMFGGEIVLLPEKPGDRKGIAIDLAKTEEELGWRAVIRQEDHIKEYLASLV